jgi:hypothetical protein
MPSRRHILTAAIPLLLIQVCLGGAVRGADKISATVYVKDSLTAAHQEATIEAKLLAKGVLRDSPLGGEPVELVVNGTPAATGMTGGDGKAFLPFVPSAKGIVSVRVRVGSSPRVSPAEGQANLVVWERRTPVLVVELSSLIEDVHLNGPLSGIATSMQQELQPMADAANELGKLTKFYYGIIYVAAVPPGADGFAVSSETRTWLETHKFPRGFVLTLPAQEEALGAKIDELHGAGWKSIKTGVGRSKGFVETFLRRRLEAIMVPEPSKGEPPRKAKVARDWKEVRKKL